MLPGVYSRKVKDLTGRTFARLEVLRCVGVRNRRAIWLCQCACSGKEIEVIGSNLVAGHTASCGCGIKDASSSRHGYAHPRFKDLRGQSFGQLKVVKYLGPNRRGNSRWSCICSCGSNGVVTVIGSALINGRTRSCGCAVKASAKKLMTEMHSRIREGLMPHPTTTHGLSNTGVYRIYRGMLTRCYDANCPSFKNYGAIGVQVADCWRGEYGLEAFLADIGNRPSPKHSLSRYLDSGSYEPGNVEWATIADQRAEAKGKKAMLAFRAWKQQFELVAA